MTIADAQVTTADTQGNLGKQLNSRSCCARCFGNASAFIVLLCSALHAASSEAEPLSLRPFGYQQVVSNNLQDFPLLGETFKRYQAQVEDHNNCVERAGNTCPLDRWFSLLGPLEALPPAQQLASINALINEQDYRSDQSNYDRDDYWATPMDLLSNGGDCEDFALTKMLALRHLDFPADAMRLTVLQDTAARQAHAVLTVEYDSKLLILDNRYKGLRADKDLLHYAPLYSINEKNWWLHLPFEVADRQFVQTD